MPASGHQTGAGTRSAGCLSGGDGGAFVPLAVTAWGAEMGLHGGFQKENFKVQ